MQSECAEILRCGGFEADTVADQRLTGAEDSEIAVRSRTEGRVLITLDPGGRGGTCGGGTHLVVTARRNVGAQPGDICNDRPDN